MEVEAKFTPADNGTFERLSTCPSLGGLKLGEPTSVELLDIYLDTTDRRLLAAGYALRERTGSGGTRITLKSIGSAGGPVHRRGEWEALVSASRAPAQWPDGELRQRVLALVGNESLETLLALHQQRTTRALLAEDRVVAHLSLDRVRVGPDENATRYLEVEVELAADGTETELSALVQELQENWLMKPQELSKFERGLSASGAVHSPALLLALDEVSVVERISARADLHGRRARALLGINAGQPQAQVGREVGLSERRVRFWLAEFRRKRLRIFPARVLDAAMKAVTGSRLPAEVATLTPVGANGVETWPVERLLSHYAVDRGHAEHVAALADWLFDRLLGVHGLTEGHRLLLRYAALLHNIGFATDPARHEKVGYKLLLAHPPAEASPEQRAIIALATLLHRKKVTRRKLQSLDRNPVCAKLSAAGLRDMLAVASLVRMADGLDYSQSGLTVPTDIRLGPERVHVRVEGPAASADAARAQEKSDLWEIVTGKPISFNASLTLTEDETPTAPERSPGIQSDDTMMEAARKVLLFHFGRMLACEAGASEGEDIEQLHQMRVATRRMRAALDVFSADVDPSTVAPFAKGLRRTGKILGSVRDLDVFQETVQGYLGSLSTEMQDDLQALMEAWRAARESARSRMLEYLNSGPYASWKAAFEEHLATKWRTQSTAGDSGSPPLRLVRHAAPAVLFERLASVRAYDKVLGQPGATLEQHHELRISAKGLRYTLEFLREVLGPETKAAIGLVVNLQDHLGAMQDAVVASHVLRDFMAWGTWGEPHGKAARGNAPTIIAPGVARYLAFRQSELQTLMTGFATVWDPVRGSEFNQLVVQALQPLWQSRQE